MSNLATIEQQMAEKQSNLFRQDALKECSEAEWNEAVALAKTEEASERVELITIGLRGGIFSKLRFAGKNLGRVATLARLSVYTLAGGDPEYFTRGAGGSCIIV